MAAPGGLGFPHAEQAVRITRTRTTGAKTTRKTAYLIVTLPAAPAQPNQLGNWARREWHIENRLHWVRDVTLAEDTHQARTGNTPDRDTLNMCWPVLNAALNDLAATAG